MSGATKFVSVDSFAGEGSNNGIMKVIRSGNLITLEKGKEATKTALGSGVVAEGTYLSNVQNKFNPEKLDYTIRESDGTLVVLNGTSSLSRQMEKVAIGEFVQIMYNGKKNIKRKTGGTAEMHDFKVLRALEEAEG